MSIFKLSPLSKQHQILFPQDKVRTYIFPTDSGKIASETKVADMIAASGGGGGGIPLNEIRRLNFLQRR